MADRSLRGRPTTLVDVGNSVARGSWYADDSGDLAPEDAATGYRKRVFRRLTTPLNAFSFLRGYGMKIRLKGLVSVAQLADVKRDAEEQIRQEPETASVQVSPSLSGPTMNVLTLSIKARTKAGAFVDMAVRVTPDAPPTIVQQA